MTATVDLANVANVLLSLAAAAVTAAIPILVPFVLKRLNIANNADLTQKLELALNAAAGGAYKYATQHDGGLSNVAVNNGALAQATTYVVSNLPDTLKALDVTPDKVTQMVSARLGALLATDPTVTAGTPPPAPVTGAPPAVVAAPVKPTPIPVIVPPGQWATITTTTETPVVAAPSVPATSVIATPTVATGAAPVVQTPVPTPPPTPGPLTP